MPLRQAERRGRKKNTCRGVSKVGTKSARNTKSKETKLNSTAAVLAGQPPRNGTVFGVYKVVSIVIEFLE